MRSIRNLYRAAQFLAWLVLFLLGGCWSFSGADDKCQRVVDAVNARLAECQDGKLVLDCSQAVDTQGDVDACVTAVKAAACGEVMTAYARDCAIFGGW